MEIGIQVPELEGVHGHAVTIVKWYKKEGDIVRKDEAVLEIEFPKVEFEISSPANGRLIKIIVKEGRMARVLDKVGIIEAE